MVEKEVIYSPRLRADKDRFYFVRQMMRWDDGLLQEARVAIDGSGPREFRRKLSAAVREEFVGRVKDVRFGDSRRDVLVQPADVCVGAVA